MHVLPINGTSASGTRGGVLRVAAPSYFTVNRNEAVAKYIEVDYLYIIIFVIVGMMLFLHFTFDI